MVETNSIDLTQEPNPNGEIVNFSEVTDPRWSGIISLPSHGQLTLAPKIRNDLYIVKGSLVESDKELPSGTFLTRSTESSLNAGSGGATVFMYRDSIAINSRDETVVPSELQWYQGGAEGMEVAPLFGAHHRLSLVSWKPGTQIGVHSHPFGEEIFVLAGELHDQHGRYPAGTWQRLHPETSHSPFAEIDTLILLRNGHLRT